LKDLLGLGADDIIKNIFLELSSADEKRGKAS
jgi:hypothetical protein